VHVMSVNFTPFSFMSNDPSLSHSTHPQHLQAHRTPKVIDETGTYFSGPAKAMIKRKSIVSCSLVGIAARPGSGPVVTKFGPPKSSKVCSSGG